jgi:uncharacterized paraquat-inducible protein A
MVLIRSGKVETPPPFGMTLCPDCKQVISKKANSCPHCGRAMKPLGLTVLKVTLWIILISIALSIIAAALRFLLT